VSLGQTLLFIFYVNRWIF